MIKILTTFLIALLLLTPLISEAFRLNTIGFELNTTASNVETTTDTGDIVTTPVHSGNFAFHSLDTLSDYNFVQTFGTSTVFARVYFYQTSYPDSTSTMMVVEGSSLSTDSNTIAGIYEDVNGNLGFSYDNSNTDFYSPTTTTQVTLNTWHYLELESTSTSSNSQGMDGRLDGTQFGTYTANITHISGDAFSVGIGTWLLQNSEGPMSFTVGDTYYDDFAINDNSGSSQNSWPGPGNELLYVPNGQGDLKTWHKSNFNIGDTNNWKNIYSVPPGNSQLLSTTTKDSDFYTVAASTTIPVGSTINVVQVLSRFVRKSSTLTSAFKAQIEKASNGTRTLASITSGGNNAVSTSTNQANAPYNPTLTMYNDPDGSAWTSATIATMEIGATTTSAGANGLLLSGMWAYVDYTPPGASGNAFVNGLNWFIQWLL